MLADNQARKQSSGWKAWKPIMDDRFHAPRPRNKWIGLNRSNEV